MIKPPVLNYAVPQRKDVGVNYIYDETLNMNVVMTESGKAKFIDYAGCSIEFATKTDVVRERDDVGERVADGLELATKTEVNRERDEDALEFTTKTAVQREGDDDRAYHLSEYLTKTFVEREKDEDGVHNLLEFVTKTKIERESDDA